MSNEKDQSEEDESKIINSVIRGDRDSFRHLVLKYQDMVFALTLRQVGNKTIAEDLTQEIFVRAYKSLSRFRGDSKFSTWLVRITLNHVSSYFASRAFKNEKRTDTFDQMKHDTPTSSADRQHEQKEFVSRFQRALGQIGTTFREVLVLCGLEGKSYEEVAQVLEIPVGTVRSRLNKARLLVKEILLEEES